jgi:alpha-galactosidase
MTHPGCRISPGTPKPPWERMMNRVIAAVAALAATAFVAVAPAVAAAPAYAVGDGLALTPPMGFNDWNTSGCAIDEQLITATADIFVKRGLAAAGYRYVNIDDCWAAPDRDPATGRLVASPERFPHGIKWLADYVHANGLKLGIYTSAGTLTCARTMPGALGHEDIDAQTFADWGVDYLKYDNCNNQGVPAIERYTRMRDALRKTGHPIVFSICEWGQNKPWEWAADVGHLWRTTGDISDTWNSVVSLFKLNAPLAGYAGPGHWNDPDMLEVGNGGMTDTEYRSHFSLWSMMAAPLLIGSDLRHATPSTLDILGNRDVIAVDQDRLGAQATVMSSVDGHWVLRKPLAGGDVAVALFNESDRPATVRTTAAEMGLPPRPAYQIRDLWRHETAETAGTIAATVPAHGTAVYRVAAGGAWWRQPAQVVTGVDVPSGVAGVPGMITPAGQASEVTAIGANHGRTPVLDARLDLTAPAGWTVEPVKTGRARLLGTDQSVTATWRVTPPAGTPPGELPLTATLRHTPLGFPRRGAPVTTDVRVPAAAPAGTVDLGDHPWAAMTNGYGPAEPDRSNGGPKPGDGPPMVINGVPYAKGIGTHAPAQLVYFVDRRCGSLSVLVGIDDDRGDAHQVGSSSFEIWADGAKVADSGVRTWADPALTLTADLTGAKYLRLVQTVGGDTNSYDRGDWATPRLTCR